MKKPINILLALALTCTALPAFGQDDGWISVNVSAPGNFSYDYTSVANSVAMGDCVKLKVTGEMNYDDQRNLREFKSAQEMDLSGVTFTNNVINDYMCNELPALRRVVLPTSVKKMEYRAFYSCPELERVEFEGPDTPCLDYVGNSAFEKCSNLTYFGCPHVKIFYYYSFGGCTKFDASMFRGVEYLGSSYSFAETATGPIPREFFSDDFIELTSSNWDGCPGVTSIELPQGLLYIGANAFRGTSITSIDVPPTVRAVYNNAFTCETLRDIYLHAPMPPYLPYGTVVGSLDPTPVQLHVPKALVDLYRYTDGWKEFYNIRPIDETIQEILAIGQYTATFRSEIPSDYYDPKLRMVLAKGYRYNPSWWTAYRGIDVGQITLEGEGKVTVDSLVMRLRMNDRSVTDYSGTQGVINEYTTLISNAPNVQGRKARIEMELADKTWFPVSFPFDVKMSDIDAYDAYIKVRKFDTSKAADNSSNDGHYKYWVEVGSGETLRAGQGYLMRTYKKDSDYTPVTVRSGDGANITKMLTSGAALITPTVTAGSDFAQNLNLVGNPYPCFVTIKDATDENGDAYTAPVYTFVGKQGFRAYAPGDDQLVLRPFEAIFAVYNGHSIKLNPASRSNWEDNKSAYNTAPGIYNAPMRVDGEKFTAASRRLFNFHLSGADEPLGRVRLVLNEAASASFDINTDAPCLSYDEGTPEAELYIVADRRYQIFERPMADGTATLGFTTPEAGTFTITLDGRFEAGWSVMLTDNVTGETVDLAEGPYTFSADRGGDNPARFSVRLASPDANGWITVTTTKPGYFAQTYLDENDQDWLKAEKLRIVGPMNDMDFSVIPRMTNLQHLDLTGITMPGGILAPSACNGLPNLVEVNLPDCTTEIGGSAFNYCTSLKTVTVPAAAKITHIRDGAFRNCYALENFDNPATSVVEDNAFASCQKFDYVKNLHQVDSLGYQSFNSCYAATEIPAGFLTEKCAVIPKYCFEYNSNLTHVDLGHVREVLTYGFRGAYKLESVKFSEELEAWNGGAFGGEATTELELFGNIRSLYWTFSSVNLQTMKIHAVTPPNVDDVELKYRGGYWNGTDRIDQATLYVPAASVELYAAHPQWSKIPRILPLEGEPKPSKFTFVTPTTFTADAEKIANIDADNIEMSLEFERRATSRASVGQLTLEGDQPLHIKKLRFDVTHRGRGEWEGDDLIPTLISNNRNVTVDSLVMDVNYLTPSNWKSITFPFDVAVDDIATTGRCTKYIYAYDGQARADSRHSEVWRQVEPGETLHAYQSYILYSKDLDTQGATPMQFIAADTPAKNRSLNGGRITVPLNTYDSEFAFNQNWQMVGNPYYSFFNIWNMYDQSDNHIFAPVVFVCDTRYSAFSPVYDKIYLRPGEGFLIQKPLDVDELVFTPAGRIHWTEGFYAEGDPGRRFARAKDPADESRVPAQVQLLSFILSDGDRQLDRTRIAFNPAADLDYEVGRDAPKFFEGAADNALVYIDADTRYDLCERPIADGLASMGVDVPAPMLLTLTLESIHADGWQVMLTDTHTGTTVDLATQAYSFTAQGSAPGRFDLSIKPKASGILAPEAAAAMKPDTQVSVTDLAGRIVYTGALGNFRAPTQGVYIITDGSGNTATVKQIVKQ